MLSLLLEWWDIIHSLSHIPTHKMEKEGKKHQDLYRSEPQTQEGDKKGLELNARFHA